MKVLGVAALCYVALTAWVYFSQRRLLYFPTRSVTGTPADIDLQYEDVWLTTRLGTKIHGWWLPCDNARFTLLFSHGNGGNISHRLESFRIFHDMGLSVLIYDYSGYGQSQGEPGEEATRADARAAWDWLMDKGVPPQSVILFGRSLGGAVTAGLAGELQRDGMNPGGIILESTFTSVPDMGTHIYPWLPVRQLARYQYDAKSDLADIRLPVLFAHSPDDEIVPYALGRNLYESYQGPKSFMEMTGDHNYGYSSMGQRYPDGLNQYLAEREQGGR